MRKLHFRSRVLQVSGISILVLFLLLTVSSLACSNTNEAPITNPNFPIKPDDNTNTKPAPAIQPAPNPQIPPAPAPAPAPQKTSLTIGPSNATIKKEANDYASYTYTVSGKVSGPVGSSFAMSAKIIDPKIGEVPLTGPQTGTGEWSITQEPNWKSVRFDQKAGESNVLNWTITGSGKEGASYAFPGCVIEFRAILRLNGVNIDVQTMQVKAN